MVYFLERYLIQKFIVETSLAKGSGSAIPPSQARKNGWNINELKKYSISRIENLSPDKKARDAVKEPDFEFRLAFSYNNDESQQTSAFDDKFNDKIEN